VNLCDLVAIRAEPAFASRAQEFAHRHQLSFSLDSEPLTRCLPYELFYGAQGVVLCQTQKGAPGPISASFLHGKNAHRRQFGGGAGQLIAKAVGVKSSIRPHVLDMTAGLGRDAFVLASLGCRVQMLEKSAVVSELLRAALEEAQGSEIDEIAQRMSLTQVDALSWPAHNAGQTVDVVYLDPMYPERDKSAKVKKEMRAFHDLVGPSEDDRALLAAALAVAQYRVVVKRPRKGQAIEGRTPSYQLVGKSCRYDIYAIKSLDTLKVSASPRASAQ